MRREAVERMVWPVPSCGRDRRKTAPGRPNRRGEGKGATRSGRRVYRGSGGALQVGSVFCGDEQSDRDPQPEQQPPQEGALRFRQIVRRRKPRNTRAATMVRMTMRFCTAGVSVQRGSTRMLAAVRASRLMVPPLTLIMH